MWAAIKSDLAEFASGAAEETAGVASKVGIDINQADAAPSSAGSASSLSSGGKPQPGLAQRGADGSVLLANAALSMGSKSLKGLQGVGSMVGGIVAPRNDGATAASSGPASGTAPTKPSALGAQLLAGDEDDEEEELGWGSDDDDDLDVGSDIGGDGEKGAPKTATDDFFREELDAKEGSKSSQPSSDGAAASATSSADKEVLQALQSKLEQVEQSRAELQAEHRKQTGQLVELRAKVEELEKQKETPVDANVGESDEEVKALQGEIEQLKLQLSEQSGKASQEHEEAVAALVREKEELEQQLHAQKDLNEELSGINQTLLEQDKASSSEDEEQLQKYQAQIHELTAELQSLQDNLESATTELGRAQELSSQQEKLHEERTGQLEGNLSKVRKALATAVKENEESKGTLASLEEKVQQAKDELEAQAADFAIKLREGVAKAKAEAQAEKEKEKVDASFATTAEDAPASAVKKEEEQPKKGEDSDELSDDWGDADWGDDE
ncbi:hypothetical protein ACHAXT_001601 [Thalassiosira profunda]